MPTITETVVRAFAHCPDVACPASTQEPVDGIRALVSATIGERGGDGAMANMVENSTPYVRFADPGDMPCPESGCSRQREISDQERPDYGNQMGGADALLRLRELGRLNGSRDGLIAAAQDAKSRSATARERLDEAYVLGQIDEAEYQRKRAVLEGIVPESAQPRSRAKKTVED